MAAIDFPNNPTLLQTFASGGRTWTWDGTAWTLFYVDELNMGTFDGGTVGFAETETIDGGRIA